MLQGARLEQDPTSSHERQRRLRSGMSVTRIGKGELLTSISDSLLAVQLVYPSLEVRNPLSGKKAPAIQEVGNAEIRRKSASVGHVAFMDVVEALYHKVPTLRKAMYVEFTEVDTSNDYKNGGEFVELIPKLSDEDRVIEERLKILGVIDELADTHTGWNKRKPCDMTVAYIPSEFTGEIREAVIDIIVPTLPLRIPLSEAHVA